MDGENIMVPIMVPNPNENKQGIWGVLPPTPILGEKSPFLEGQGWLLVSGRRAIHWDLEKLDGEHF